MKSYPRIDYWNHGYFGEDCIAAFKYDGSNMRFEWGHKNGWYKFGTRNVLVNEKTPLYGLGVQIFLQKYGEDLDRIFRTKYPKCVNFVVFCEFFGENSFAGLHQEGDVMDVVLFDVSKYKHGFLSPYEFLDNFGHLHTPKILWQGEYNDELLEAVRTNVWSLKEGVIAKGVHNDNIWMTKIKTNDWLLKVKEKFGQKALAEELNNDKFLLEGF